MHTLRVRKTQKQVGDRPMNEILRLFPKNVAEQIKNQVKERWYELEEIRLRLYGSVELNFRTHLEWIKDCIFSNDDSIYVLNQLSEHSLYRLENELREGYITISGGHRVGLAGGVTTENGMLKQLQYITFFNIRIAKQINHIANPFLSYLHHGKQIHNTLIIGAPQTGKTTMLRDLAKWFGNGFNGLPAKKVGIIDERSEIAASLKGVAQHQVGKRTDVLDACPKVEGLMMMIRSMSPEILIVDEIGKEKDVQAIMEAIHAGVSIICTAHGFNLQDIQQRPSFQALFQHKVFTRFLMLQRGPVGNRKVILLDHTGEVLLQEGVKNK